MINIGHRAWLRRNHCFRRFGVSQFCCPCGYTKGSKDTVDEVINLLNKYKFSKAPPTNRELPTMVTVADCLVASNARVEKFKVSVANRDTAISNYHAGLRPKQRVNQKDLSDATPFIYERPCHDIDTDVEVNTDLNNHGFKLSDFQNSLWFAHCDFRELTYMRRPNRFYRGDKSCVFSNVVNEQNEEDIDQNDVHTKKPWVFDSLPSARIENSLSYGPFHALMNLAILIISLLTGTAGMEFSALKLCLAEGRLPFLDCRLSETFENETAQDEITKNNNNSSGSSSSSVNKNKKNINNNTAASNRFTRNIPYLLANEYQQRSDAFHNCIIIPKGTKDIFGSKNILTGSSNLKGNDKIQYVNVFINFDLLFTDLNPDYKAFCALTSSVVSDMLSPTISRINVHDNLRDMSSVDDLFDRVIEMISVYEAFFPDAVQNFTTHELVDIVKSIRQFGPLQSWWEYPGERFMKLVKDCCPAGGQNITVTMHNLYAIKEMHKRFNYMPPAGKLDNLNRYRDNLIKINKTNMKQLGSQMSSNYYVMNELVLALYNFMATEVIENKHIISPFYRLYMIYYNSSKIIDVKVTKFITKNYPTIPFNPSFYLWIQMLVFSDFSRKLYNLMITDKTADSISEGDLLCGNLFDFDKHSVIEVYNMSPKAVSLRACVKGIDMIGRGIEHCETKEPLQPDVYGHTVYLPANRFNHLNQQWSFSKQTKCWSKFKHWIMRKDKDGVMNCEYKTGYGQTNYFFRIFLPSDAILHNLAFANVTARNVEMHKVLKREDSIISIPYMTVYDESEHPAGRLNLDIFDLETQHMNLNQLAKASRKKMRDNINSLSREFSDSPRAQTYDIDMPQFFCLNRFYSTNVAVCGVTKTSTHWVPILVDDNKSESANHSKFYTRDTSSIRRLYLIDLHPHRRNVEISLSDSKLTEN
jgi:hypothetical protein